MSAHNPTVPSARHPWRNPQRGVAHSEYNLLGLELDQVLLGAEPMPILLSPAAHPPQLPPLVGADRDKARIAWGFDFTHRSRGC